MKKAVTVFLSMMCCITILAGCQEKPPDNTFCAYDLFFELPSDWTMAPTKECFSYMKNSTRSIGYISVEEKRTSKGTTTDQIIEKEMETAKKEDPEVKTENVTIDGKTCKMITYYGIYSKTFYEYHEPYDDFPGEGAWDEYSYDAYNEKVFLKRKGRVIIITYSLDREERTKKGLRIFHKLLESIKLLPLENEKIF